MERLQANSYQTDG